MPAVPSVTTRNPKPPNPALRFGVQAAAWMVALLAAMRFRPVQVHILVPFTEWQARFAAWQLGRDHLPVVVGLECSGADVIALALGVTLAFPVAWRARLSGAAAALLWLTALNVVRLATLGLAAGTPAFPTLHLQVWPAALMIGALAYLAVWIRLVDRTAAEDRRTATGALLRFGAWAAGLVVVFQALAPWWMQSRMLVALAQVSAATTAAILGGLGAGISVSGSIIISPHGSYLVTPECLMTPLMPVYLAAVMALSLPTRHRLVALAAFGPLFAVLGLGRLLTVALPPLVGTSAFLLTHGFYQFALGVFVTGLASWYGHSRREWWRVAARASWAVILGFGVVLAGGGLYHAAVLEVVRYSTALDPHALQGLVDPADVQGAWLVLPAFQLGLSTALLVALPRPVRPGHWMLALILTAAGTFGALVLGGALAAHFRLDVPTTAVRAWAVLGPILAVAGAGWVAHRRRRLEEPYIGFWHDVGERFPDLGGAASTAYYRANEQRLLTDHLPRLNGIRLLKTDLWDEAKNTRILGWARDQGAAIFGVDISGPIVRRATAELQPGLLVAPIGDVRHLPFPDGSFDAVYSMGTIEHFDDSEQALREIARVLKPGGRAIVGVPNRYDPFLRPLLVSVLSWFGAYGYGYEKSFSRRALCRMMERAGFEVVAETAILFVPGWLRMLDLVCYCWCRPLAPITALAIRPFAWLDRHVPAVRRHGYLLTSVGIRRPR